jgi:hypothetical protein
MKNFSAQSSAKTMTTVVTMAKARPRMSIDTRSERSVGSGNDALFLGGHSPTDEPSGLTPALDFMALLLNPLNALSGFELTTRVYSQISSFYFAKTIGRSLIKSARIGRIE